MKGKEVIWTAHPDDSHTAKIGRYEVTIMAPQPWSFWRGDHKGIPCHTGPGVSRTIAFRGSHSSTSFTVEGAKARALWVVENDMTGHPTPDALLPTTELEARRLWEATCAYVDSTYGTT